MSVLREVAAAAGPSLAPYAVPDPAPPRFDEELGERPFVLEASTRAISCTTARRACSTGWTATCACSPGDALYALGLARLAESGDLPAVAELSDLISRSAQAHAEGRGAAAEALWDASADLWRQARDRLLRPLVRGADRAARHHVGTSLPGPQNRLLTRG